MKKFKNTFGVTGSTHAINHFAELAVKEGWKNLSSFVTYKSLCFNGNNEKDDIHFQNNSFWYHTTQSKFINIDDIEGWNKALDLMKEVEEEQLYGECLINEYGSWCYKKVYKLYPSSVFPNSYEFKGEKGQSFTLHEKQFKLVPECAYLAQEAKKEKKYDFVCPHSGEGFMYGDDCYIVCSKVKDENADLIEFDTLTTVVDLAIFHTEESALKWNRDKFGVKEEINNNYNFIVPPINPEKAPYKILIAKEVAHLVKIEFK